MNSPKTNQQKIINPIHNLTIIYKFYCKLNQQKLKHKSFDDVTHKAETMDLHQFMTFCKDFQLIAKQHRNSRPTATAQNSRDFAKKQTKNQIIGSKQKITSEPISTVIENQLSLQLSPKGENADNNEFLSKANQLELPQNLVQNKIQQNTKVSPERFLKEKRLAQIYKTEIALPEGTVTFDGFSAIMKKIAEEMYTPLEKLDSSQNWKTKNKQKIKTKAGDKPKESQTNDQKKDSLVCLLHYLRIDSKQQLLQSFKQINQMHGNKDHLVLMRSPVKKVQTKHNPLGRYAGVENLSHSRLIGTINKPQKIGNRTSELPSIKSNNSSITHAKKQLKGLQKQNFQSFLTKHRNQIEQLNKNYESRAKVTFLPDSEPMQTCPSDSTVKYQQIHGDKKNKKYSQRHKDKILGDAANKELGRLIDASELYSDDIFNKYLQLNYSSANRYDSKSKLAQSKPGQFKS